MKLINFSKKENKAVELIKQNRAVGRSEAANRAHIDRQKSNMSALNRQSI